jgi:hypothetical protein
MDAASGDLEAEEHIHLPQPHGVHGEEVHRHNPRSLSTQERRPGLLRSSRRRTGTSRAQDPPHRGWRHPKAQANKLTLDPAVSPGGVLTGQLQDQPTDLGPRRGPARSRARIRPLPGHQFAVPAQPRGRGDEKRRPPLPGQRPGQSRQEHPIRRPQARTDDLPARTATSWRKTSSSTSVAASPRGSTIRSTARRVSVYISDQIMTTSLRAHHPQPPTNQQLRRRTQVLRPHTGSCCRATCLPPTSVCSSSRLSICCSSASAAFASAPSSIRASSSIDIAGFSGTTRVFQTQAPPRDAKRARQLSPSVVATTPAQYLVRHRCGRATPRRTVWSCHWSRPPSAFVADHGRRAAVGSQCGHGGLRG